jgi:hypothetical protein
VFTISCGSIELLRFHYVITRGVTPLFASRHVLVVVVIAAVFVVGKVVVMLMVEVMVVLIMVKVLVVRVLTF